MKKQVVSRACTILILLSILSGTACASLFDEDEPSTVTRELSITSTLEESTIPTSPSTEYTWETTRVSITEITSPATTEAVSTTIMSTTSTATTEAVSTSITSTKSTATTEALSTSIASTRSTATTEALPTSITTTSTSRATTEITSESSFPETTESTSRATTESTFPVTESTTESTPPPSESSSKSTLPPSDSTSETTIETSSESTGTPTELTTSQTTVGPPECSLTSDKAEYFPHESDCTKYYECFAGNRYLYTCSNNLWWHQSITQCDYPGPYCKDFPGTTSKLSSSSTETTETGTAGTGSTNGADPRCRDNGTSYWAEPGRCDVYVECIDGDSYLVDCPDDLYFSDDIKKCVSRNEADCCREYECN